MPKQQRYQKHFYFSLLLHIIILSVLVISFEFSSRMPVVQNSDKPEVINALVLDAPPQPTKIVQKPTSVPLSQPKSVTPPPKPPVQPEVKREEIPIKTQAIVIPDKKQKKPQEELIQKQLLADLKKQTEKNKKQKQKELQAEFEKEMKEVKAKALQNHMLQEQKRVANARAQQMQGVVDKYKALILQTISQHWIVPPNVNKKRFAELLIRLTPGGAVLDVQLIKSSGEDSLDRSARAAVFKASPLPVPTDSDSFEPFRQFVLKVKPENVLVNDG